MSKTFAQIKRENEKYEMCRDAENVNRWEQEFYVILTTLSTIHATPDRTISRPLPVYARSVRGNFVKRLCPYSQRIRIDALDAKDYPNSIDDNSVFVDIEVDLEDKTFRIVNYGHIWLNNAEQRATYLAMAGMKDVVKVNKGKWLRQSSYKDAKDFAKRVTKFWEDAMRIIDIQTGGYPYKKLRDDATPVHKVA